MNRRGAGRAGTGLLATVLLLALVVPRSLPQLDLLDPAARSSVLTEFGLRSLASLLAGYLALVFLGLLLSVARLVPTSAAALVGRWTRGGLAGGLRRFVGISALAVGVLPLQPLAAHAAEPAPVLAPDDATTAPTRPAPGRSGAPRLEPAALAPEPEPEPPTPLRPAGQPPAAGPARRAPRPEGHVLVEPGDSFWSIAERLVAARVGRPVSDAEVVEPWLTLIEANRDRLPDPADPDLLHPGQVLRLPD